MMRECHFMKILPSLAALLLTASAQLACSGSSLSLRDAQADGQPATGGVESAGGSLGKGGAAGGSGGASASGGTNGNACLDSSGNVSAAVKSCTIASDCTTSTIRTCCGSDLAVGLAKTASCAFPTPDCSGLGCAKMLYPRTDDGDTADANSAVSVKCLAGLCTSYVIRPPTAGAGGSGGVNGTGGASGTGGVTSKDAAAADAATGACTTDGDCVFRAMAGCCGQCLAQGDPVPPTIPCGAACAAYTTCACVNGHCSVGSLPSGSSCDTAHDLCQVNTKCCIACGPRPTDGSTGCALPVCTAVVSSTTAVGCPLTM
jgi:hypothetical protein